MGAEIEGGARAGGLGVMGRLQAQVSGALERGAQDLNVWAHRIWAQLEEINRNTAALTDPEAERTGGYRAIPAGGTVLLVEGRPGYIGEIQRIAITADGATDVDIFVGSVSDIGFRERISFAGAGRASRNAVEIDVPEGAQISATATGVGNATVAVQVKRQTANPDA